MTEIDGDPPARRGSLLVSIPKAGTHMILKLYGRAGYLQVGWGKIEASDLRLPREEMITELLEHPTLAAIVKKYWFLKPYVIFALLAHHARTQVGDPGAMMSLIVGFPDPGVQEAWREIQRLEDETLFVPGLVVATHEFPWTAASWRFLAQWGRTGSPAIVYFYRDPRAQLVSMIKFLAESDYVAENPIVQVYRPILQSLGTMDRMLSFAISDPSFPFRDAYRKNRWMLHHPNVLTLRFEDFVGEEGGGSRESQAAAVERWARFLAVDTPVEQLTDGLFGGTRTFSGGRVDGWRNIFQEHHLRDFDREFGDVLAEYGYAGT